MCPKNLNLSLINRRRFSFIDNIDIHHAFAFIYGPNRCVRRFPPDSQ